MIDVLRDVKRSAGRTAQPVIDRASANDLVSLASGMQVGAVVVLERDPGGVESLLADRIRTVPRLRRRLVTTPFGSSAVARLCWSGDALRSVAHHGAEPRPEGARHAEAAFGSAMITSVGMWGVRRAFSPLAAYYRVPVLVLVGSVEQRAVVVDGEVVARPILGVTATFDHRYVDGSQAVRFAAAAREYCAKPSTFEP